MEQRTDILANPWHCGLTNRHAIKAIFLVDCSLFIISVALFIRNAVLASDVLTFIIIDFLMLSTSSFQCILGGMTLKKMRLNQNVLFLKHYVNMKIIHVVFFVIEYGIYVPIVCNNPDFRDQQEHICTYMGLRLSTFTVWFLLQIFLLALVGRIYLNSNRDPRFHQRRVILENIYQQPTAESSNQQVPQNEPMGITVECEGMPFSLVNSGPVPFKIFESLPMRRKITLKKQQEDKYKDQNIEVIDIRYLVMSNSRTPQQKVEEKVYSQIPNKRRFEDQLDTNVNIQIMGNAGVEENYFMRNKNTNQTLTLRKLEDYKTTKSLAPEGILTRNK